jgi:hypothetical protein
MSEADVAEARGSIRVAAACYKQPPQMTQYSPEDIFTALAYNEAKRHDYAATLLKDNKLTPSVFSKLWYSEVISHHSTMMRYAGALVEAWFSLSSQNGSVVAVDRFLSISRCIANDASTLAEIQKKMFPANASLYYLDEDQRLALLPAIVNASRRVLETRPEGAGDAEENPRADRAAR